MLAMPRHAASELRYAIIFTLPPPTLDTPPAFAYADAAAVMRCRYATTTPFHTPIAPPPLLI